MNNESWVKITSLEDFTKMRKGGSLIEYPLDGSLQNQIDLSNSENFRGYIIELIRDLGRELEIRPEGSIKEGLIDFVPVSIGALHKDFQKMITEGKWWYLPNKS